MAKQQSKNNYFTIFIFILLLMTVLYVGRGRRRQLAPLTPSTDITSNQAADSKKNVSAELMKIINSASSWQAVGPEFYGKAAPDMAFKDIYGQEHKISDYLGKEVMVVFWATWCPPCNTEIKHLKNLTNELSPDEFKILAISSQREGEETVRKFAEDKEINYTVTWVSGREVVEPYAFTEIIPSAFFIDKAGKFKLITKGMMDEESIKSVVNLE